MRKITLFLVIAILLGGCGVNIRTTGFLDRSSGGAAPPRGASFAVLENGQAANPILDREIRSKIESLLVAHGYPLAAGEKALYFLAFHYDIHPGLQMGATTSYNRAQMQLTPVPDGKGGTTYINTLSGATTVTSTLADVYTKHLILKIVDARSVRAEHKEKVIWIGDTLSTDSSSDLRHDIDYLLVATFANFARDTGRQLKVSIDKDNPDVRSLRTGSGIPPR